MAFGITIPYDINGSSIFDKTLLFDVMDLSGLTLGDGWTSIATETFNEETSLTSIILPSSIINIDDYAFQNTIFLSSVTFSNTDSDASLNIIGTGAFKNTVRLTTITIPDSVIDICSNAFQGSGLTTINIPKNITNIGNDVFSDTTSLINFTVDINNTNYSVDGHGVLFNYDKTTLICYPIGNTATSYEIPSSVITIGINAFIGAYNLTSITFAESSILTTIGINAFKGLKLSGIFTIPNTVTSIQNGAFNECVDISSINIPTAIQSIGDLCFYGMSSLTTFTPTITNFNTNYSTDEDGVLFNSDKSKLIHYPAKHTNTNYEIINSVNEIAYGAFMDVKNLETFSVSDDHAYVSVDDHGVLFTKNKGLLIQFPNANSMTSYTIPNTTSLVMIPSFRGAINLQNLKVPAFFYNNSFWNNISTWDLLNMPNILEITIVSINTNRNGILYDKDLKKIIKYYPGRSNTTVTIANNIEIINKSAFQNSSNITEIIIPSTVSSIGDYAFQNCIGLTKITFATSNVTIGENAFQGCSNLTEITFTNSTNFNKSIDLYIGTGRMFYGISNEIININTKILSGSNMLRRSTDTLHNANNVHIEGYTYIGDYAFQNATNITTVKLPSKLKIIGNYSFQNTSSLISVNIPDTVTLIGEYAFNSSNINNINIPHNVSRILDYAFLDASGLTEIMISNEKSQLLAIGSNAFNNTDISSISIPVTLATIGENAFFNCNQLESVVFFETENIELATSGIGDGKAFYGATNVNISVITKIFDGSGTLINATDSLGGATKAIVKGYDTIHTNAFTNAVGLTEITIFPSVININDTVFVGCTNLENIIFEESTNLISTGAVVGSTSSYKGSGNITISINVKVFSNININNDTLFNATDRLDGAIKASVKEYQAIGYQAFINAKNLKSVYISNSNITAIETQAFANATNLETITFETPSLLNRIEYGAFFNTPNLTSIIIPSSVISIDATAFLNSGVKNIFLENSSSITSLNIERGNGKLFFGAVGVNIYVINQIFSSPTGGELTSNLIGSIYSGENKLTTGAIIEGYTSIGKGAFQMAMNLSSVSIAETITKIGDNSFQNTDLTSIYIPSSVTDIGNHAFYNCRQLESVNISDINPKIVNIGNNTFEMCINLTDINLPNTIRTIGEYAFYMCNKLNSINLVNNLPLFMTIIERSVFQESGLTSIIIPDFVKNIELSAFQNSSLNTVVFTSNSQLKNIKDSAFDSVKITSFTIPNTVISIGSSAFARNTDLTSIIIPENVTDISDSAFIDCTNLTNLTFEPYSEIVNINSNTFQGCSSLDQITMNDTDIERLLDIDNNTGINIDLDKSTNIISKFYGINRDISYIDNTITPTPICFPKGTLVTTDQGDIVIEKINPDIHTIRKKRIVAITQSQPLHTYIVSIEKDALGQNIPCITTQISKEHKLYYKGKMLKAKELVDLCKNVKKIPYTGEILYNVLLEKHEKMMVNNLICETLHPDNIMARIHNGNYNAVEKSNIYKKLRILIESGDMTEYNKFYTSLR